MIGQFFAEYTRVIRESQMMDDYFAVYAANLGLVFPEGAGFFGPCAVCKKPTPAHAKATRWHAFFCADHRQKWQSQMKVIEKEIKGWEKKLRQARGSSGAKSSGKGRVCR